MRSLIAVSSAAAAGNRSDRRMWRMCSVSAGNASAAGKRQMSVIETPRDGQAGDLFDQAGPCGICRGSVAAHDAEHAGDLMQRHRARIGLGLGDVHDARRDPIGQRAHDGVVVFGCFNFGVHAGVLFGVSVVECRVTIRSGVAAAARGLLEGSERALSG